MKTEAASNVKALLPTAATAAPPAEVGTRASAATADAAARPEVPVASPEESKPPVVAPPAYRHRKWLLWAGSVVALVVGVYFLIPWVTRR